MEISEHKKLAAKYFNDCWDFMDQDASALRDRILLDSAFTSRAHWQIVGGARESAIADWMISRTFGVIGCVELTLEYAKLAFTHDQSGFSKWLKASMHEGLARAYSLAGNISEKEANVNAALKLLGEEPNVDDAKHIREQLADLI